MSAYHETLEETETPERTAQLWQMVAKIVQETVDRYFVEVRKTDDGGRTENNARTADNMVMLAVVMYALFWLAIMGAICRK